MLDERGARPCKSRKLRTWPRRAASGWKSVKTTTPPGRDDACELVVERRERLAGARPRAGTRRRRTPPVGEREVPEVARREELRRASESRVRSAEASRRRGRRRPRVAARRPASNRRRRAVPQAASRRARPASGGEMPAIARSSRAERTFSPSYVSAQRRYASPAGRARLLRASARAPHAGGRRWPYSCRSAGARRARRRTVRRSRGSSKSPSSQRRRERRRPSVLSPPRGLQRPGASGKRLFRTVSKSVDLRLEGRRHPGNARVLVGHPVDPFRLESTPRASPAWSRGGRRPRTSRAAAASACRSR